MYKYRKQNDQNISLHDCRAEKMSMKDGTLSFIFPDGLWILDQHPDNVSEDIVKTDLAQVDFQIIDEEIDGVEIFLFKKNKSGKVIREEWESANFINAVNDGTFQVEFLYKYQGYQSVLYKCWVWFDGTPYNYECEITLHTENITYSWNEIVYDHTF